MSTDVPSFPEIIVSAIYQQIIPELDAFAKVSLFNVLQRTYT